MKASIVAGIAALAVLAAGCGASDLGQSGANMPANAQTHVSGQGFGSALDRVEALEQDATPDAGPVDQAVNKGAAAYCTKTGGQVFLRRPEYDTNSSNPLVLAGEAAFCQYTDTTTTGGSRIHILLNTLYTKKPSLAALAYILKPTPVSCGGNPASCYCSQLGASDQFGGDSGAGGSWVNTKSTDVDLEACIFPDRSSIDSWGLAYHAYGIIRGIDLTKVMRYQYTGSKVRS